LSGRHEPPPQQDDLLFWDELSAGSFSCGNDLGEALVTAQRIPARIEAEIAVLWASRDLRHNFALSLEMLQNF
jgi:hypothetical protein